MRRVTLAGIRLLPLTALLFLTGCSVTGLQLKDFAFSTGIRVFVQSAVNVLQASILDAASST